MYQLFIPVVKYTLNMSICYNARKVRIKNNKKRFRLRIVLLDNKSKQYQYKYLCRVSNSQETPVETITFADMGSTKIN